MYRILIADDEQLERMVLQQSLEEYFQQRCMIKTAANGKEAVETALNMQADIAILDIEMPGMDGLEAARAIAAGLPSCRILMLTAYSEFAYAQKAVEIGAFDYLLKPCSDEELHRALAKAAGQIDRQRESDQEKERSAIKIQNLTSQMEEQLVLTVMGGSAGPQYVLDKLKELEVGFSSGVFIILQAQNGNPGLERIVKSSAWPNGIHPLTYQYDGKMFILCIADSGKDCSALAKAHIQGLSDAAAAQWGKPLFAAFGTSFHHIKEAQLSCFQAQMAIHQCSEAYPVQTYEGGENEAGLSGNPLADSILAGDHGQISRVAHGLVKSHSAQQLEGDALIARLEWSLEQCMKSLRDQTGLEFETVSIDKSKAKDLEALSRMVASLMGEAAGIAAEPGSTQVAHLNEVKREIEEYILAHYREDISLPVVANEMHYSPAYFSKLFKQCFQCNFIAYLTAVRMEKAKAMLKNPDLTIREVGERAGYKDPNYFTKVFRKSTGQLPSEYRSGQASALGGKDNQQERMVP